MLNFPQGNILKNIKKIEIMALQYVHIGSMGCLLTAYVALHITFDFRHALLRKDKAKVAYRHYS